MVNMREKRRLELLDAIAATKAILRGEPIEEGTMFRIESNGILTPITNENNNNVAGTRPPPPRQSNPTPPSPPPRRRPIVLALPAVSQHRTVSMAREFPHNVFGTDSASEEESSVEDGDNEVDLEQRVERFTDAELQALIEWLEVNKDLDLIKRELDIVRKEIQRRESFGDA